METIIGPATPTLLSLPRWAAMSFAKVQQNGQPRCLRGDEQRHALHLGGTLAPWPQDAPQEDEDALLLEELVDVGRDTVHTTDLQAAKIRSRYLFPIDNDAC